MLSVPSVAVDLAALREVWSDRTVRVLAGLLFLGFGAFIALTTWLQALLQNYRVSSTTAGTILVAMVLAGAVGAAALPPLVVNRRAERRLVGASVLATVVGALILAFVHTVAIDTLRDGERRRARLVSRDQFRRGPRTEAEIVRVIGWRE